MESDDIEKIIEQVKAGEINEFSKLVRAYQADVWRVVSFAVQNISATEDLLQQTFISAYHSLDRFELGRDFGAWLCGIARNVVRMELRKKAQKDRLWASYQDEVEIRLQDSERSDRYDERLRRALEECAEKLPAPAKQALSLRYEETSGYQEISKALGRTVVASRQLLQRARAALRLCIEKKMADA